MNIVLIGFMGCGKSSTARFIAKNYGMRFVDTDRIIEKKTKLTIKTIFERHGESHFRKLEKEVIIKNLSFCDNCVIATGGGLACHFDNMKNLKKIGWVFYLDISFNDIIKRVKNKTNRPLLNDIEKAENLFNERRQCYNKAHFTIDASKSTHEIAKEILQKINS